MISEILRGILTLKSTATPHPTPELIRPAFYFLNSALLTARPGQRTDTQLGTSLHTSAEPGLATDIRFQADDGLYYVITPKQAFCATSHFHARFPCCPRHPSPTKWPAGTHG